VLVDTVARTRRVLAGSTANESSPRFASRETAATFVRDNNLFRVALAGDGDVLVQLTDVSPKKKEPKLTESQQFLKDEERKLLKQVDEAAARRKRGEERKERQAPPRFEIAEGQSVSEALTSGDGRFAFLLVAQKAEGAKTADVPSYVTESAYVEAIPARTNVGDRQETRRLAVLDLQDRKSAWAYVDGVTEPEPVKKEEAKKDEAAEKPTAPEESRKEEPGKETRSRRGSARCAGASPDLARRHARRRGGASGRQPGPLARPRRPGQREGGGARSPARRRLGARAGILRLRRRLRLGGRPHALVPVGGDGLLPPLYGRRHDRGRCSEGRHERRVGGAGGQAVAAEDAFYLTTSEPDAGERHLYRVAVGGGERTRLTTRPGAHFRP
jgi:hypothetical protein